MKEETIRYLDKLLTTASDDINGVIYHEDKAKQYEDLKTAVNSFAEGKKFSILCNPVRNTCSMTTVSIQSDEWGFDCDKSDFGKIENILKFADSISMGGNADGSVGISFFVNDIWTEE